MSYKNIFFLLVILNSSLTCHAASRSLRHALEAFDAEYSGDPACATFKGSPYYETATAPRPSKAAYTAALTKQLHLYKLSLGGGGEAAATPTETAAMKDNAFRAVSDALDQWKSYLEPKEGVASSFWDPIPLNPGNGRFAIRDVLTEILEFVPTSSPYSDTVRTALENFREDVERSAGATTPIADGGLTFTTIGGRIMSVKATLPAPVELKAMGSHSTSRDIYSALAEKLIAPRTFSLEDIKQSIAWARQRINWLEKKIDDLSAEIGILRGRLALNTVTINDTTVPTRQDLVTAGVNLGTGGPALILINQLADAFLEERAKVDGVRSAITDYKNSHSILRESAIFNLINAIYTVTGDTLLT